MLDRSRSRVYDLEQDLQDQVFDLLMPTAVEGSLSLDELLSDHFVRDLHARMFGQCSDWAGWWPNDMRHSTSIAPEQVAIEVRNALDTITRAAGCTPMLGNWVLLFMRALCESIRSPMEMGAPQASR